MKAWNVMSTQHIAITDNRVDGREENTGDSSRIT
jgi:hypothetical protein